MRIGIEAKWFFEGPPGGHTYARNFTEAVIGRHEEGSRVFLRATDRESGYDWPSQTRPECVLWGNSYLMNRWLLGQGKLTGDLDWVVSHNFAPAFGKAKRAVIIHDLIFLSHPSEFTWKERLYFKGIKASARSADLIITVSEFVARDVRARGYARPDQPVITCPCAAASIFEPATDQTVVAAREKYHLPENYILYVGRLNARKNIRRLIQAYAAADIDPEIPLVLVGAKNWKMFNLDALVEELGLTDRIRRLGYVELEDLPALYTGARFFTFVPLAEGFGIPPLEAMACGTPVLASNTTSVPEVVQNSGVLVDPLDVAQIQRGIESLANDQALYEDLKGNCLSDAQTYSWDRSATRFLEQLETMSA